MQALRQDSVGRMISQVAEDSSRKMPQEKKKLKQCLKSKLLAALGYDCGHGHSHWSLRWPGNVTLYLEEDWSQGETK